MAKIDAVFTYTYSRLNDPKHAIMYYKRLLSLYQKQNRKTETIKSFNNIGMLI
ncbi:hypothetical protein SCA31_13835 [Chryseobacterium sp. SIMBA_028]